MGEAGVCWLLLSDRGLMAVADYYVNRNNVRRSTEIPFIFAKVSCII